MPEVAHDDAKSPKAAALGYEDARVNVYQGPDDVLVFLPNDRDDLRHDTAIVAGPESHVDVAEAR